MSKDQLWDEMCSIIKWHNKSQHCCVDTINRLWKKDPFVKNPNELPMLEKNQLYVTEDMWPLDKLKSFICEKRVTDQDPTSTDGAIIILHRPNMDYLMDGRRRINYWMRNSHEGLHRVLLINENSI